MEPLIKRRCIFGQTKSRLLFIHNKDRTADQAISSQKTKAPLGPGAVAHLKRILDEHGSNQAVRNIVHLKLRDVYKETGDAKAALAQLDQIIAENVR